MIQMVKRSETLGTVGRIAAAREAKAAAEAAKRAAARK